MLDIPTPLEDVALQSPHPQKITGERKPKIEPYLRGPIPWEWLRAARSCGGSTLAVGLALWHLRALQRTTSVRASLRNIASITGISVGAARRGLHALEGKGLISADRQPGRKPLVTLHERSGPSVPCPPAAEGAAFPLNSSDPIVAG